LCFTGIPQEFEKRVGRFGLDLPHGRDEKEKHKPSNVLENESAAADLQFRS
jgi:hypothetical protein